MSPQTCTNCGSELAPGQRFCPACGTPVAAAPTEAVAAPPPKKTPRRGRRLLFVGGGCLVLLACICMALFVVGSLPSITGVATLEPVEVWEPVKVISERELTPEEFFQRVEGDERFAEVYALASEQGYTQAATGVDAKMSDGSVLAILPLSSPEGETIAAFRVEGDERSNSLLARFQGEALVLYDREGRAEITEQGVRVFDAAGTPIGETQFQESSRPPALAKALQQEGCMGGNWEDYDHCTRRVMGMRGDTARAFCAAGMATCGLIAYGTIGGGLPACLLALATTGCPFVVRCELQMTKDEPPTFEINVQVSREPCRQECVVGGQEGVREVPNYRFEIVADDDRKPPGPWPPKPFDLCEGETRDYINFPEESRQVTDCGGNKVPIPYEAILASLPPFTERECRPIEAPAALPPTIEYFYAMPPSIQAGQWTELKWKTEHATRVTLDGMEVSLSGTSRAKPRVTTKYSLVAEGPGGKVPLEIWVEVTAAGVTGVCSTPGAWCVVEDEFDLGPNWPETWVVERNEVNIAFPVDGGLVSGDFHFGVTMDESNEVRPCIKRRDWSGRLSGHFDPESGWLGDSVEDATATLEVEGCEGAPTGLDRTAISWWATYDWTTGELRGEVEFETEVTKFISSQTFHGIAVED